MHAQDVDEDACARTRASLGAYVRGGLSRRDGARVDQHLEECRACAAIYLELTEVNSRLGALLAPLVLGTAAAAYLGGTSGGIAAAGGTAVVALGRVREALVAHAPTAAVASAAASAVVAGMFVTMQGTDPRLPQADDLPVVSGPSTAGQPSTGATAGRPTGPSPSTGRRPAAQSDSTPDSTSDSPGTGSTEPVASLPTGPTNVPTSAPSPPAPRPRPRPSRRRRPRPPRRPIHRHPSCSSR